MKLSEAFRDQRTRVLKVVMFVDMSDSTTMKEKKSEADWINTYGWFYDAVTERILADGGDIVKLTGDGVMSVWADERAVDAINAAIKIQEHIAEAVESHTVDVYCSIGIGTGVVVNFHLSEKLPAEDYIGAPVDRAARLCSAATPQAIFADEMTISAANATKITSVIGMISPRRNANEYVGNRETIALKGFNTPAACYEILWGKQRFGVKPPPVPQPPVPPPPPPVPPPPPPPPPEGRYQGQITSWDGQKGRGFILSSEEPFYFDARSSVSTVGFKTGERVWFVPRPGPKPGGRRTAGCTIALGQDLVGVLAKSRPREGGLSFGFVRCTDSMGVSQDIFAFLGEKVSQFHEGDKLRFIVGENQQGPTANEVRRAEAS